MIYVHKIDFMSKLGLVKSRTSFLFIKRANISGYEEQCQKYCARSEKWRTLENIRGL